MNKKAKYALNGALIFGLGNAIVNIIRQKHNNPNLPTNWNEVIIASAKGCLAGAATGFGVGSIADLQNSCEKPINTDVILLSVATKVKLNENTRRHKLHCQKANWLIDILKLEFPSKLSTTPFRFGSTEKGTALDKIYDIDICALFKPNSFSSTENMFQTVYDFLNKLHGTNSIINVRRQKKSIGVIFNINGKEYKVDILPTKLTQKKGNKSSGYLYVNNEGLFSKPSYTKTDVDQLSSIKLSETQKRVLLILKNWKVQNSIPISSHLLQYLILDAYQCNWGRTPAKLTEKIIMVFQHIVDYLDSVVIRSIENTNNVLTDISDSDKTEIISSCKKVIEDYKYQPNSVLHYLT